MTGAVLGNYIAFKKFIKDEEGDIRGAILFDYMENKEFKIRAKVIVNCAGHRSDLIRFQDNPNAEKQTKE
jgi:glycerol-3-phosphate dehydrogenase